MKLKLEATRVLDENIAAYKKGYRFIVNQGGTGSSKTYSLAQLFLILMYEERKKTMDIVRKTLPALKATSINDLFEIMKDEEVYKIEQHNRTDLYYEMNSNKLGYFAVDDPQKIRSRRRDILWMNEANEFKYDDFQQLNMRTNDCVIMDYNPSDEFHWIYDKVLTRDDAIMIKSTYKDNPFLSREIIKQIEGYKELDKNYWRIYGMGERGMSEMTVYTHWELDDVPTEYDDYDYGLDFGYNNPTALVQNFYKDKVNWWHEVIYESHLTTDDLIKRMNKLGVSKEKIIWADPSAPEMIEQLIRAGYNVRKANNAVNKGIDAVKSHKLYITRPSVNLLKEVKSYSWKEKDGKPLDEPVKQNDHGMDCGRYSVASRELEAEVKLDIF